MKRLFDIVFAFFGLAVLSPILIIFMYLGVIQNSKNNNTHFYYSALQV
jgi:lipopolysaccharide/colanic/teichoic acid biosynthesis glycosyltransferase